MNTLLIASAILGSSSNFKDVAEKNYQVLAKSLADHSLVQTDRYLNSLGKEFVWSQGSQRRSVDVYKETIKKIASSFNRIEKVECKKDFLSSNKSKGIALYSISLSGRSEGDKSARKVTVKFIDTWNRNDLKWKLSESKWVSQEVFVNNKLLFSQKDIKQPNVELLGKGIGW